jgi:hypothetical protein
MSYRILVLYSIVCTLNLLKISTTNTFQSTFSVSSSLYIDYIYI